MVKVQLSGILRENGTYFRTLGALHEQTGEAPRRNFDQINPQNIGSRNNEQMSVVNTAAERSEQDRKIYIYLGLSGESQTTL